MTYPPSPASTNTISLNACTHPPSESPTPWDEQFAQEIASGGRCAGLWLDRRATQPLWWQLTQARRGYPEGDRRNAFEAGFLRHLQQRLITAQYRTSRSPPPR